MRPLRPGPDRPPSRRALVTRRFDQLSGLELYRILGLRQAVLMLEQRCLWTDIDERDLRAIHIFPEQPADEPLDGYVRVLPPGLIYDEASLGRLATSLRARGTGLGRALTAAALAHIDAHLPGPTRILAQAYLERFYGEYSFSRAGEPHLKDGILHLEMVRPACNAG